MRITDLVAGTRYIARQSFRDDGGVLVLPGDRLTYLRHRAVPVTGAFEVSFREETLTFHEDRQREVCEHAERFVVPEHEEG
ncbi:hypothetical protein [Rubrivirga sp. IMCC43871]|uniref:hypothetical protein n=1 Tax=Rubrivirga sp. IMCC43871 TaxID=3391575 RepID=UPI0039903819